ncbi:serine/threonine protein phosphatase [filamentous cyanobacterium CCP5]|nr:serine/threonine protein phosphatase [filamentous cyanobacterium CCP5]
MARRIFIGDVHGHYQGLKHLWEMLSPASTDEVYFLGDLIDRGPESAQVVEYVRQRGTGCVMGNHEQLLLGAFGEGKVNPAGLQGWLYGGGQATLASYSGDSATFMEHVQWMRSLPLYLDLEDVWLVHAGLNPGLPIAEQSSHDLCWIREVFHSSPRPYFDDKWIITGHTITFTFDGVEPGQVVGGQGWYDIDTGAYHPRSGWLTGLDWSHRRLYQVNVFDPSRERVLALDDAVAMLTPTQLQNRSSNSVGQP